MLLCKSNFVIATLLTSSAWSLVVPPPAKCQVFKDEFDETNWSDSYELAGPFSSINGPEYRWKAQDEPYQFLANIKDKNIKLWSHVGNSAGALYIFVLNDARGRALRYVVDHSPNPGPGCEGSIDFTSEEVSFAYARVSLH